jgi:flagellar assembly protein FliH
LSRVLKSHLWVATGPCQLEPPDPELFVDDDPPQPESEAEETTELEQPEKILEAARQEAERILAKARAEAERATAAAAVEAERLKAAAEAAGNAAGNAAGYQTGLAQIRREMSGKLAQALALLSTAELEHQRRVLASEPEILKLAVAVAAKIINAEISLDPGRRLEIVKQALSRFGQASTYKIRINPADLQQLVDNPALELQSIFSEPKVIEMAPDATIAPTGCFIETDHGNIDARLRSQLELVASELLEVAKLG